MLATTDREVGVEDVTGVQSRVSWASVLGGAGVTVAAYFLFTALAAGVGLSLTEARMKGTDTSGVVAGVVVIAIVIMAASLFYGGWVSTQLAVGENTREAVIHGVLVWTVVTAFSLLLVVAGVRTGYMAVVGSNMAAAESPTVRANLDAAKQVVGPNVPAVQPADTEEERQAREKRAVEAARTTAWAVFGGTLLGLTAAVAGALIGRGPQFRIFPHLVGTGTTRRPEILRG